RRHFLTDFAELVKARLTLLVLLTTAVGYYLAAEGPVNRLGLFHAVFGTAAAAAGAAALNQWWERKLDALMHRTRTRPVPAGRMRPRDAVVLGAALSIFGVGYLAFVCNALSAALAAITIIIYVFAYTPLKRVSTFNTALGAVPGALPPMIGWAAARGTLNAGAWMLFAILFFWQLPHFFRSVGYLAFVCNALSAALAAITIIIYVFAYTPLKRVSTFNTALGAVPGALPPMIGWAAARGTLNAGAWMLFAILFFWQLPHFF